ncbi:MAG: pantetheine-phosphate adenylyltransferase [Solirubrobacterales bacterium]|nr:pantetheine-phosphate adenylyltransferase [Solirubrobacterales bacterium]MBV9335954.1 pantetheine-phosphate adenylyltransferase [Solirubrobacterales bacterium]MBV9915919.1 pantetheine-phosphate adenylyltransferase [Solirubrobacterales bacterium]
MAPDNRIAICPGTFDPVTNGHLDVIGRASAMYDKVIVGVVNLPWRKGNTVFSTEERVAFVRGATGSFGNVEVEPFSTLLVDFARQRGAMAIVKGLRAISDFEYELEMNQLNRRQDPEIESVYLMASAKYSFLSSSGIKELATFGGEIEDLVPAEVVQALKERLGR